MPSLRYDLVPSPVGDLLVVADPRAVRFLSFQAGKHPLTPAANWSRARRADPASGLLREARRQLNAYFHRELREFDLPLAPRGTPFQESVWNALLAIPYGETRSYGEQAQLVGNPKASRAVGAANGKNPIAIIIPCHRVIGSTGALTGFGGGLGAKEYLLDFERGQETLETLRDRADAHPMTVNA